MSIKFDAFKQKLTLLFDETIVRLSKEFPNVKFSQCVEDEQVNLSALITSAPTDTPDLVELVVSVRSLDELNSVVEADVIWGDGCGHVESSFKPEPVEATEQNLESLYNHIPQLLDILRTALLRGRPF